MDDRTAARLLVGAVLGEEVESLQPLPQERSARAEPSPVAAAGEPRSRELLTVRRVDFAATVRTASGGPSVGCWWRCRRRASPTK